jgi:type I restriction enzyme S subunit
MLSTAYPVVGFDQVFRRIERPIALSDFEDYSCIGTRLGGQGAYVREVRQGSAIKRKKQSLVREGDVLYNKLFAWRGTFAIADASVDGSIASDKFPLYELDRTRADQEYVRYWFQTRHLHSEARKHSKGAAALSKLTLNPPDFWRLSLPLPEISEQRRIVQRLNGMFREFRQLLELRTPIDAVVQGRRAGIGSEARLIFAAELGELNREFGLQLAVLDLVLTLRPRSGPSFACSSDGAGIGVIMPSALGGYRLEPSKVLFGNGTERLGQTDLLEPGDILISRGNKRDQVGLCIVYPGAEQSRTYANLLMKMRVVDGVLPEFVKYWVMSPLAVRYIRQHTKGTSPSVQKINQRSLIQMPFPKGVSVERQEAWVSRLDTIFDTVDEIEWLVRDQFEQVKMFPDAVLTATFKGEL